jgi:hypothetical protein
MSEEEQFIIVGRTTKEYNDSKARLAALLVKAGKLSSAFSGVGTYLQQVGKYPVQPESVKEHVDALCTVDDLRKLVSEIDAAIDKCSVLRRTLTDLNAPPRD